MKIATVIKPRADGTVVFERGGKKFVFRRELDGQLSCDVDEKDDVRAMLASDRFYPLQQEDEPLAQQIVQEAPKPRSSRGKKDKGAAA